MKNFRLNLIIRTLLLVLSVYIFFFVMFRLDLFATLIILGALIIYQVYSIIYFIDSTNRELARFLRSIKYSDFSQSFSKIRGGGSFQELTEAFNEVISEFQKTRSEKEEHFRYLQTVIQHVGVGLLSFNTNGKVEFINNAAKKILKVNSLQEVGALNKVNTGLGTTLFNIKAGEKTTVKIVDENELLQLMVYSTEFKMRNQKYTLLSLQNIQSELEEKEMEAWFKLIRVLTHEIMNSITPISSLAGTVNYLLECEQNAETKGDIKVAIDTIKKRSEGLIHFVDNYRSLTRIPRPNFQIFLIRDLIDRIRKLMDNELKRCNIELLISITPENLELTADPELIEQVLINLILNSVYFLKEMSDGRIELTAQFDSRGKTVIKVSDNGPGISEDLQEKIFIPFFSTKQGGSGIGLSLSKQIMRSHGGNVSVISKEGRGATFVLSF